MVKIADLSNFNLAELKGLQYDIEKEIKDRQQQEVKKAREEILSIAQGLGISVEALVANPARKPKNDKTQKVRPQYQNPANSSQTRTGRGRQPKWIADGLAGGKTLNDFRIQ
jgi:DNA-binding protein H-NS